MGRQSEAGRFRYGPPRLFPGYDGGQDQAIEAGLFDDRGELSAAPVARMTLRNLESHSFIVVYLDDCL